MNRRYWFCILILNIIFLSLVNCLVSPKEWRDYKLKYGKSYDTKELDDIHLRNYELSKEECEMNNKLFDQGQVKFRMAINEYSDRRPDLETLNRMAELNPDLHIDNTDKLVFRSAFMDVTHPPGYKTYDDIVNENLAIDWRQWGAVSPVGNQKDCNSCWAFSSSGALEAQIRIKHQQMVNLSPKYLLDCATANRGCSGGWVRMAYDHIMKTGGIATKESYPYQPKAESCNQLSKPNVVNVTGIKTLPMGDEKLMAEIVYNIGPVTASIDCRMTSFNNYKNGVYIEPKCKNGKIHLCHSFLVIGFGSDWTDGDYWIIKNSYGKDWGMDGYMLMARNRNNMCGIASLPQYPIL